MDQTTSPESPDKELAKTFEAVAHPARIHLLKLLQTQPRKYNEFKGLLGINSSGNLSHHINKLEGFIENQPDGTYQITILGKRALFLVEVLTEEKRRGVIKSYLLLTASLFYAIWLTFAFYLGSSFIYLPLVGLAFTVLFYFLLRVIVKKETKHENWQFLWSSTHKM